MLNAETPAAQPENQMEVVPSGAAYSERARLIDRELREWMRRRAEQRANARRLRLPEGITNVHGMPDIEESLPRDP